MQRAGPEGKAGWSELVGTKYRSWGRPGLRDEQVREVSFAFRGRWVWLSRVDGRRGEGGLEVEEKRKVVLSVLRRCRVPRRLVPCRAAIQKEERGRETIVEPANTSLSKLLR